MSATTTVTLPQLRRMIVRSGTATHHHASRPPRLRTERRSRPSTGRELGWPRRDRISSAVPQLVNVARRVSAYLGGDRRTSWLRLDGAPGTGAQPPACTD